MRYWLLVPALVSLMCCSSSEPHRVTSPPASTAPASTAAPPATATAKVPTTKRTKSSASDKTAPDRECLPVVAAKCGCVYACGVGTRQPNGTYAVRHDFWKNTTLTARIADWCVAGTCTAAFHAEIICSGICPRRPADSTCEFRPDPAGKGERCMGSPKKRP